MEQKDIERVTPLIRALYYKQKVFLSPNGKLYNLGLTDISNIGKGILVLRALSSITDEEASKVDELQDWDSIGMYADVSGFAKRLVISVQRNWICFTAYQYLIQCGLALPYYDSTTNTTLTPEQMQEYGIIKLK